MKPNQINLFNGFVLLAFSFWGYFGAQDPSLTALIPAAFGLALVLMNPPLKKENKVIAHIVVVLTLLILVALVMPLKGAIGRGDTMGIVRVGIMMLSSAAAMVVFINSFIQARKAKNGSK